ncbi:MAG: mercuric reductase [Anaerolineae bacterium]|nr:mercuric reductase [Anaerolineae bacterium]
MVRYDAIVIGTGQSGPPLARLLADQGKKVAVCEGGVFGGSCVNYGCTPSKAMIGSANAIQTARRGGDFGFTAGDVVVDYPRIVERRDAIVRGSRDGLIRSLEKRSNITLYCEYAVFEAPHRVRAGADVIEAERIYLNTGARPAVPPIDGLDRVPYLDNVRLMNLTELPRHLLILGGGYIGLEFAQAFRRFGSDVTVIDRSKVVIEHEAPEFSEAVQKVLEAEGIRFVFDADTRRVEQVDGQIRLHIDHTDGSQQTVSGTHLLVATGRQPNSDRIGADAAGLELDEEGYIRVDDHLRTSVEGVYALGDVNGRGAFTHTSYDDYLIIADNLKGGNRKVSDRILTYAVFTDPPLARIGMNERDVRAAGRDALVATMPMTRVSRAREWGQTNGMMKVLVDARTRQFLGATLFGLSADEAIHAITDLMYAQTSVDVMRRAVHIHPTVAELLPTLLESLKPLE